MFFNKNERIIEIGENLGYLFGYFLFTTLLFLILNLLDKMPYNWSYFHIMRITIFIVLISFLNKWILK